MKNIIEISNLTKTYGKNRGVSNLSLSVKEGEIYGFLGPNGAGKSTTIRSMLNLISYSEGSISIFSMDAVKDHEEIMKNIGYMPSEAMFYPNMTVKETIDYAAKIRGLDCHEEAEKLCERLNLDVNKKIKELSLGNRKKVAIVCAMQHKPKLFIFDEPTSGLDPLMQAEFFALIHEYVNKGTTCLLSTHVLSEVQAHCQRVAILKEGKLLCEDKVDRLMETQARKVSVKKNGQWQTFTHKGKMDALVKELAGEQIEDLLIEEPTIEEIFMHFYESEEVSNA